MRIFTPLAIALTIAAAPAAADRAAVRTGFDPSGLENRAVLGCGKSASEFCQAPMQEAAATARRLGFSHRDVLPYLASGLPWGVAETSGIPQPWQASWTVEIGPLGVPSHSVPIADWREDFAKPPPPSLRPSRHERPKQHGFSNTPSWHHHGRRR